MFAVFPAGARANLEDACCTFLRGPLFYLQDKACRYAEDCVAQDEDGVPYFEIRAVFVSVGAPVSARAKVRRR
jgi:hypothetical protein